MIPTMVGNRLQRDVNSEANKDSNQAKIPDFCKKFQTGTGNDSTDQITGNKNKFASTESPVRTFIIDEPQTLPVKQINSYKREAIKKSMESGKKLSEKESEQFPGNQGFLGGSSFFSSSHTDNFSSGHRNFRGKFVVECKNWKQGSKCSSGFGENQELPGCFPDRLSSGFLSETGFNDDKTMANESLVDMSKMETLWEHQELIEQLKMELRKVSVTGLPTILEESETSPMIMDDLKPWKIDENLAYEDCMDEVTKLCKNYREIMRKFDILNYQKMYAMGFLQLKDPFRPTTERKPSPLIKSIVSQNLWPFKHKRHGSDPVKKFVDDLQGDLEVAYVGQVCQSWEFLHWQYGKALDLWNSDPHGIHQYNEVADEFQQFQVLLQRFMEDERFQGPRVQSYVKNRCIPRNLLQVPAIREDDLKDKKNKARRRDRDNEYYITSEILVKVVEESIQILWQFVRSDKDSNILPINGHKKMPHDLKLLLEVQKTLLKKERKVREIVRSEKCIVRRFQQRREDEEEEDNSDMQTLLFFAQVDMKLVCRVLNMSKLSRDHLIWCHNKLSRISFVHRKICVQPATFLMFPC